MANDTYCELRVTGDQPLDYVTLLGLLTPATPNGEAISLNTAVPAPSDLHGKALWRWRLDHWGVTGDATTSGVTGSDTSRLTVTFTTPWAPPLAWLAAISTLTPQWQWTLLYLEPLEGYAGGAAAHGGAVEDNEAPEGGEQALLVAHDFCWVAS